MAILYHGELTARILAMQKGERIELPTYSWSAISTVGGLRRAGRIDGRRYTVRSLRSQGRARDCMVWRLE